MTPTEIAWVAGYLEGEGCFDAGKKYPNYCKIRVPCTDLDVLEKLQGLLPGSHLITLKPTQYKQGYCWWTTNQNQIRDLVDTILPYMSARRVERIGSILGLSRISTWNPQVGLRDPVTIAWFSGIIEGEGSFRLDRFRPCVQASMSDQDTMQKVFRAGSCGFFTSRPGVKPGYKTMWKWGTSRTDDGFHVMKIILPHMGARRAGQILEILTNAPIPKRAYRTRILSTLGTRDM